MSTIAEKWNAFCEWQQQPYQVTEKSQEHHRCRTCGEEFQRKIGCTVRCIRFIYCMS